MTVGGQIGWNHAGHRQVDQGGHLEIHPTSKQKPVQLLQHRRDVVVLSSARHHSPSDINTIYEERG